MTLTLSTYQVEPALQAWRKGLSSVETSPDLGLTAVVAEITASALVFPDGERLDWAAAETIASSPTRVFVVDDGVARPVEAYSEWSGRAYSLYPTPRAPTLLISGIPMHRIKGTDPWADTIVKVKAAAPAVGSVLDTATGLGYTAIEAARTAERVVTVELDPAVLEVARQNPWSRGLFGNPKVEQLVGDSFEVVPTLPAQSFSLVIHDPPTFSLAGELYSREFYKQLYRVLRANGRLFHYVGDPSSKSGQGVTRGVTRRLQEAGFVRVVRRPEAFGLVAYK